MDQRQHIWKIAIDIKHVQNPKKTWTIYHRNYNVIPI